MTETESIILEHLRHIRGAVDDLRVDVREMTQRVSSLACGFTQVTVRLAELSNRVDRLSGRVERIERRLELTSV